MSDSDDVSPLITINSSRLCKKLKFNVPLLVRTILLFHAHTLLRSFYYLKFFYFNNQSLLLPFRKIYHSKRDISFFFLQTRRISFVELSNYIKLAKLFVTVRRRYFSIKNPQPRCQNILHAINIKAWPRYTLAHAHVPTKLL